MLQNVQRGPNVAGDSMSTSANMSATASATAHVKGAWTVAFASTTVNSQMLVLQLDDVWTSAANTSTLLDIGVGASGSEQVLIADVNVGGLVHGQTHSFPIQIKAGTRVAVRVQSAIASKVISGRISLIPAAGLMDSGQIVDTYGATTATSIGTQLTTPSTASVKTAWQQIVAATLHDTAWVTWSLAVNPGAAIIANKGGFDVGYGAAGLEQPLVQNARWEQLSTEQIGYSSFVMPCNIPAGTRLVIRWDSTGTTAVSAINACVHCIT